MQSLPHHLLREKQLHGAILMQSVPHHTLGEKHLHGAILMQSVPQPPARREAHLMVQF